MIKGDPVQPQTGRLVVYDGEGVNPFCASATHEQLASLVDGRRYQVEFFSAVPTVFDGPRSSPVPLFVIPGGNYTHMEKTLAPLTDRIRQLIIEFGSNYLGICAGAIAAGNGLLCCVDDPEQGRIEGGENLMDMCEERPLNFLSLYSGSSCIFSSDSSCGTTPVAPIGSSEKPYPLYVSLSPFFPHAAQLAGCTPVLAYAEYSFEGDYPVAALTQQIGNRTLLLSGVHPEISAGVIKKLPPLQKEQLQPQIYESQLEARNRTIQNLETSSEAQDATMRNFLDRLGIHMITGAPLAISYTKPEQ
jgi:glutamine amidotransferase-like uncharacterized protein